MNNNIIEVNNNLIDELNDGMNIQQSIINKQLKQARFKNFCLQNPDYFKLYYQNNLKEQYFYCVACKHEYLTTHKARHIKTNKHKKNCPTIELDYMIKLPNGAN